MIKISKQQERQGINNNEIAIDEKEQLSKELVNKKSILETTQLETDSIEDTDISYEVTPEIFEIEKRENRVIKLLFSIICIVMIVLGIGFYHFYPLIGKISGSWFYHENSLNYQVINKGKESRFTILNLQDQKDVNLIFISQLKPVAANRYKAEETKVQLEIKKNDANTAGIKALREDQLNYSLVDETAQKICFSYTKDGLVTNFGDTDINQMFEYQITDFKYGIFPIGLSLTNKTFAYGGLKLAKD